MDKLWWDVFEAKDKGMTFIIRSGDIAHTFTARLHAIHKDKCDGCGKCMDDCPKKVCEVIIDDYDNPVVKVRDEAIKNLRYICAPCKPRSHGVRKPEKL